jgi:hypothetical protein
MKRYFLAFLLCLAPMFPSTGTFGQQSSFRVLAFYSTKVEPDHVLFAEGALKFFSGLSAKNNFTFDSTSNWDDMNDFNLGKYQVVVWLNDEPSKNILKMEAPGWAFMWPRTTIKIQTGRGLWISSVAAYFTSIVGLHCRRSSPSMIVRIRSQNTFQAVSYRLTMSGTSGNQALA